MIVKNIDNKKIIIAYDDWNGEISDDNYYIATEIDFADEYMTIRTFSSRSRYSTNEEDGTIQEYFVVDYTGHSKREYRCLYFSPRVLIGKVASCLAGYDLACMPYKRKFPLEHQKSARRSKLRRMLYRRLEKEYENILKNIAKKYRLDEIENNFYAIGGRTIFYQFVDCLSSVQIIPDEYLKKDIQKYRGAAYAFMDAIVGRLSTFRNKCTFEERAGVSFVDSKKWNWRDFLCCIYWQRTRGTNKFLDSFPGNIPFGFFLGWNTDHNPSRIYLLAHRTICGNSSRNHEPTGISKEAIARIKILERSSDDQIKKAVKIAGAVSLRKTNAILDALRHIFIIDPPSTKCTMVGWAKHAMREHQRNNERKLKDRLEKYRDIDILAPRFPVDFTESGIVQLRSPEEIIIEGVEMQHCVGFYVPNALSGKSYIFSAQHENERATIEIDSDGNIIQIKGVRNSKNKATQYARSVIEKKLAYLKSIEELSLPEPNMEVYKLVNAASRGAVGEVVPF